MRDACIDSSIDVTTAVFFANILRYGILLLAGIPQTLNHKPFAGMVFTSTLGFQTPQFLTAVVTSISLAVGLSFQSVLSNFAAGVMLLVFRPYSVGDKVMSLPFFDLGRMLQRNAHF